MTQQIVDNGDTGLVARTKINDNFGEIYNGTSAVNSLNFDASLAGQIKQNSNSGTIVASQSDAVPLTDNGRDVGGIGDLTVNSIVGLPIHYLGSGRFQYLMSALSSAIQQPPGLATDTSFVIQYGINIVGPIEINGGVFSISEVGAYFFNALFSLGRSLTTSESRIKIRFNSGVLAPAFPVETFVVDNPSVPHGLNRTYPIVVNELGDGASWSDISGDLGHPAADIVVDSSDVLYVCRPNITSPKVSRSTNGGTNWLGYETGLPAGPVHELDIDSDDTLYAATQGFGVFQRPLGAAAWVADNIGILTQDCHSIFVDQAGGYIYIGTANNGIFRRPFTGTQWLAVNIGISPLSPLRFNQITKEGDTIYAVGNQTGGAGTNGGIFQATDFDLSSGAGWTKSFSPASTINLRSISGNKKGSIYASGDDTAGGTIPVFKTTNAGASWGTADTGLPSTTIGGYAIKAIPFSEKVYMGLNGVAGGSNIWKTTNAGGAWVTSTTLSSNSESMFLQPLTNTTQFKLYSSGTSTFPVDSIDIGTEPVTFSFELYCDSANSGMGDGGLFPDPSVLVGWDPTESTRVDVYRVLPFLEGDAKNTFV